MDFLPILTHFCFEGQKGHVYAYDDRTATMVGLKTNLNCAVKGSSILSVLKSWGEDVGLEQKKSNLMLRDKASSVELPIRDPEEYIYQDPEVNTRFGLGVTPDFMDAMLLVAEGCNKDAIRAELSGITLLIDQGVSLFSTDNVTITGMHALPTNRIGRGKASIIVPKTCVTQVGRVYKELAGSLKSCQMRISDDLATVIFDFDSEPQVTIVGKLIVKEPLDYPARMHDQLDGAKFALLPPDFASMLERSIALIGTDMSGVVNVAVADKRMLYSSAGESGNVKATWPIDWKGTADLTFDARLAARLIGKMTQITFVKDAIAFGRVPQGTSDLDLLYCVGVRGGRT